MSRQTRRAGKSLILWVAASVVLAVASFVIGSRITTAASEAESNAASTVTAAVPIEERTIVADTRVDGVVRLGTTEAVFLGEWTQTPRAVVTSRPLGPGDVIQNGSVMLEISGRPLIALTLNFPLYRDVLPLASGPDVEAIQSALQDLGLYSGAADGTYGALTAHAVERLYEHAGYPAPAADPDALQEVQDLEQQLTTAEGDPETDPEAIRDLRSELALARTTSLTPVHASEIAAIAGSHTIVTEAAAVGAEIGGEVVALSVRTGLPEAVARVNVQEAADFSVGEAATISQVADSSQQVEGVVLSISEFREGDGEDTKPGYDVVIGELGEAAAQWPDEVAVKVLSAQGTEETGLAVPLTAIRTDADGDYVLVVVDPPTASGATASETRTFVDPVTERREVEALTADATHVLIAGDVAEGDLVVVGASS